MQLIFFIIILQEPTIKRLWAFKETLAILKKLNFQMFEYFKDHGTFCATLFHIVT